MAEDVSLDFFKRLSIGICAEFGKACEVAIHDLSDPEHSIQYIENGHVTGRQVGDGPSEVVLSTLQDRHGKRPDRLAYLTRTQDGRILKSTTIFQYDDNGEVIRLISINFDISGLISARDSLSSLLETSEDQGGNKGTPTAIHTRVRDVLDTLITQSIESVGGKAPAMMNREEKKKAIQYLSDAGAFLITKAGDIIAQQFGISKYTMYNYIDKPENVADSNQRGKE